jgi:hypothetical protein
MRGEERRGEERRRGDKGWDKRWIKRQREGRKVL